MENQTETKPSLKHAIAANVLIGLSAYGAFAIVKDIGVAIAKRKTAKVAVHTPENDPQN